MCESETTGNQIKGTSTNIKPHQIKHEYLCQELCHLHNSQREEDTHQTCVSQSTSLSIKFQNHISHQTWSKPSWQSTNTRLCCNPTEFIYDCPISKHTYQIKQRTPQTIQTMLKLPFSLATHASSWGLNPPNNSNHVEDAIFNGNTCIVLVVECINFRPQHVV